MLYVPFRNHGLITTSLPTSHGYEPPAERARLGDVTAYFVGLFTDVATTDNSPFLCVAEALRFRNDVCGGEARIRDYCHTLARDGGARVAEMLGTEVLTNKSGSITRCCLVNIRLPLTFVDDKAKETGAGGNAGDIALSDAQAVWDWIYDRAATEFDTYFQIKYYRGAFWVRFSAQIYLGVEDFEWGARTLLNLCERAKRGEWRRDGREPAPQ